MKRRPHILSHNKGCEYPRDVVVVDTETVEVDLGDGLTGHKLAFGWAFYARRVRGDEWTGEAWFRFDTPSAFWTWVARRCRKRGRLVLYAHNVEFDGQVLDCFGEMHRRRWRVVTACLEGPPTIIKWRRGNRSIQFLDTLNLWRVPLAEIGKKVGLAKLDMPADWSDREAADAYCRRDVEVVWKALLEWWCFLRDNDLGNAAPTLAGQAMSTYRHRFMSTPIFIDVNEQALSLAREAYLGGRCECFRVGLVDEPGVVLDVNSMYPAVMRDLRAPVMLHTVRSTATLADLERYARQYAVVADVEIVTDEPAYPHVVEGRLCFPVGRFRQSLATPEIVYALERGHVKKVYRVAVYEAAEIFREFVEWVWGERIKARERGDALSDWQLKILGNSLYGKFGQRGRRWEVIGEAPSYRVGVDSSFDLDSHTWRHVRQLGKALQELCDDGEAINSHPAIAAHVTSAARVYLWRLIQEGGRENVWYCDTDSLLGRARLLRTLAARIDPRNLGTLKHEASFPWVDLRAPKDYTMPEKERRKGVRSSAEPFLWGGFVQMQWHGWAGSIRRGRLDIPTMSETVKILTGAYQKGTVRPDGIVDPLHLA